MIDDIGARDAQAKIVAALDAASSAPSILAPRFEHDGVPASFYRSVSLRYWLGALALGALLWILVVRLF